MLTRDKIKCLLLEARFDEAMIEHERACLARAMGLVPEQIVPYSILDQPLPLGLESDYQAVIIGGTGDFSVVKDHPNLMGELLAFIRHLYALSFPTLGICYGHQVIAQALGATVITQPHEKSETGTYEMHLTQEGRKDPLLASFPPTFLAQEGHHDAVVAAPENFVRLAYSENCPWQAFHVEGHPIYGFQFHPELVREDLMLRIRNYSHVYASTPEELERVLAAIKETDNQSAMRRFIDLLVLPRGGCLAEKA